MKSDWHTIRKIKDIQLLFRADNFVYSNLKIKKTTYT